MVRFKKREKQTCACNFLPPPQLPFFQWWKQKLQSQTPQNPEVLSAFKSISIKSSNPANFGKLMFNKTVLFRVWKRRLSDPLQASTLISARLLQQPEVLRRTHTVSCPIHVNHRTFRMKSWWIYPNWVFWGIWTESNQSNIYKHCQSLSTRNLKSGALEDDFLF